MTTMTLWAVSHQKRPTFYLDAQVQGIVDAAHAAKVASDLLGEDVLPASVMAINYEVHPASSEKPAKATNAQVPGIDRYAVNDALTAALAGLGWASETEDDDEWLNDMTHQVADMLEGFGPNTASVPRTNEPRRATAQQQAAVLDIVPHWTDQDVLFFEPCDGQVGEHTDIIALDGTRPAAVKYTIDPNGKIDNYRL